MGFNSVPPGMPPSPGPPQVFSASGTAGMVPPGAQGVPVIGNMGPPASSMGPPPPSPNHISNQPPPTSSAVPHLHTPVATPPLNHEGSPMPPPSTTPNSHPASAPTPTSHNSADLTAETSNDSGITTTASGAKISLITASSLLLSSSMCIINEIVYFVYRYVSYKCHIYFKRYCHVCNNDRSRRHVSG